MFFYEIVYPARVINCYADPYNKYRKFRLFFQETNQLPKDNDFNEGIYGWWDDERKRTVLYLDGKLITEGGSHDDPISKIAIGEDIVLPDINGKADITDSLLSMIQSEIDKNKWAKAVKLGQYTVYHDDEGIIDLTNVAVDVDTFLTELQEFKDWIMDQLGVKVAEEVRAYTQTEEFDEILDEKIGERTETLVNEKVVEVINEKIESGEIQKALNFEETDPDDFIIYDKVLSINKDTIEQQVDTIIDTKIENRELQKPLPMATSSDRQYLTHDIEGELMWKTMSKDLMFEPTQFSVLDYDEQYKLVKLKEQSLNNEHIHVIGYNQPEEEGGGSLGYPQKYLKNEEVIDPDTGLKTITTSYVGPTIYYGQLTYQIPDTFGNDGDIYFSLS